MSDAPIITALNLTPRVFISYSHDSPEHSDRVRQLADRLRSEGIDCMIDQYILSPAEGWPLWMDKQIRDAHFVLLVCTETYHCRVMNEEKPGMGLGVRWEGHLTYQHLYNQQAVNSKFIPVLFESDKIEHIPIPLQSVTHYQVDKEEGYEDLYRRLTNQPRYLQSVLGQCRSLPALEVKQNFFAGPLMNLPFERNPFFTGRKQVLKDLRAALTKKRPVALTQAISGLGGIGKTQTVLEYAYRYANHYQAIFWVKADSHLTLTSSFIEIATLLNLPEKNIQAAEVAVRAVIKWLEHHTGWLLIFDNADSLEIVKPFCPRNAKGHILLTSRAQVFQTLHISRPVKLDTMMRDEAFTFLFTRTGRDDQPQERMAALELANELGYLPLALEQAAAFIVAMQVRFQDYLAQYRKQRLRLLEQPSSPSEEYPASVATTWTINFSKVEQTSPAAADLLTISAFLNPDHIPFELISKGREQLGPAIEQALADVEDDPLLLHQLLEPLTRYSLVRLDIEQQTYSLHRLVQEAVQAKMSESSHRLWIERVIETLNEAFPSLEFKNWLTCERLLPHAKQTANLAWQWQVVSQSAAHLLNEAGTYCYYRGLYKDAEPLYQQALTFYQQTLGPDHTEVASSLNNLAALYYQQGKPDTAVPLYQQSLAIRQQALGLDHPDVAQSLNNLAELYRQQRKFAEAEPLYQQSLAIRQQAFGTDHPIVATALNNLALLFHNQGRLAEAESLYQQALAIVEKTLGRDHPFFAAILNSLGGIYYLQEKFDTAEPLFRQGLSIRKKALGLDHPDVAQSLNNLAGLYRQQHKFAEAEPLYQQALAIFEKGLGTQHPHFATCLEKYVLLLRDLHRDVEAAELEARVKAIRQVN